MELLNSTSGAAVLEPAPAALGAPPREASASLLTSGLLTLPEAAGVAPGPLVGDQSGSLHSQSSDDSL